MITVENKPFKVLGIVTEYNPLHNGHAYHINKSKEATQCDLVVAVMSGNFVQRGEPAIADKWTRAEWAIQAGVDLVIELPVVYATSSAEHFAYGAIHLLDQLQVVDAICFGSESGHLDSLLELSRWHIDNKDSLTDTLKSMPSESFSRMRDQLSETPLERSNDILGVAYLNALQFIGSKIAPFTIQRIANAYHQTTIDSSIASATAIRQLLKTTDADPSDDLEQKLQTTLPAQVYSGITSAPSKLVEYNRYEDLVLSTLRQMPLHTMKQIHDMPAGFEHRLKTAAQKAANYSELMDLLMVKHLTRGRIQRILTKTVLGIQASDLLNDCQTPPSYCRILGFSEMGKHILKSATPDFPRITMLGKFKDSHKINQRHLDLDCLASDLYALLLATPSFRNGGKDWITPPVQIQGLQRT